MEFDGKQHQDKGAHMAIRRPESVNIVGTTYSITYLDKPSEVDIHRRASLWGQVDFWTRSIRVFDDGKRAEADIWHTIIHEILHAIAADLHLKSLEDDDAHDDLDILSLALTDVFFRNGWMAAE